MINITTATLGTLAANYSLAEISAMLAGTADAPIADGQSKVIALDTGDGTIAMDVQNVLAYSSDPGAS